MTGFIKPKGTNFRCADELPASDLSKALFRITSFLQSLEPYEKLERYEDWWEHDGLHFDRGSVDFNQLFAMINSPRALLEMPESLVQQFQMEVVRPLALDLSSHSKPFHRNYRGFVNAPNSGYSQWAYIVDRSYSETPEHYVSGIHHDPERSTKAF